MAPNKEICYCPLLALLRTIDKEQDMGTQISDLKSFGVRLLPDGVIQLCLAHHPICLGIEQNAANNTA
eukprot:5252979-Amphidinium_carterae.1